LKIGVQPIQWLRKVAISQGVALGNPIVTFHLENLLYRLKFILMYQNMEIYNNYEFWNSRALRQYAFYLLNLPNSF
jgi:hypothetical protein